MSGLYFTNTRPDDLLRKVVFLEFNYARLRLAFDRYCFSLIRISDMAFDVFSDSAFTFYRPRSPNGISAFSNFTGGPVIMPSVLYCVIYDQIKIHGAPVPAYQTQLELSRRSLCPGVTVHAQTNRTNAETKIAPVLK